MHDAHSGIPGSNLELSGRNTRWARNRSSPTRSASALSACWMGQTRSISKHTVCMASAHSTYAVSARTLASGPGRSSVTHR